MPTFQQIIASFDQSVNQRVTTKNTVESIDPIDVGGSITDLADLLVPYINSINSFDILGNASGLPPINTQGVDGDIYFQFQTNDLTIWKKFNGVWISKTTGGLGFDIVDGNINLQTSVSGMVATVSSGQWAISNVIYAKATQTQFTLANADANFDRIDAIFANNITGGTITLQTGIASSTPAEPATPVNSILVAYIYVPSLASGQLPYITDNNMPPTAPEIFSVFKTQADVLNNSGNTVLPITLTGSQQILSMKVIDNITGNVRLYYPNYSKDTGFTEGIYGQFPVDGSGNATSQDITLLIYGTNTVPVTPPATPPVITFQPQNQVVVQADSLTLMVQANNATGYQWFKDNVLIPGATLSTLVVTFFNPSKAGNYRVDVSNTTSTVSSNNAVVTNDPGIILINRTASKSTGGASLGERSITISDGIYTRTLPTNNSVMRVRSAATQIIIRQAGSDSLQFLNDSVLLPVLGGDVDNTFNAPFVSNMEVFNDN